MRRGVCSLQDRSSLACSAGTWEGPLTLSSGRERGWPARDTAPGKRCWPAAGAPPGVHLPCSRPTALAPRIYLFAFTSTSALCPAAKDCLRLYTSQAHLKGDRMTSFEKSRTFPFLVYT